MDLQQHYPNLYALANQSNSYAQFAAVRAAAEYVLDGQVIPLSVANQMCSEIKQLNHDQFNDFLFPVWAEISRKSPHDKHFNDVFLLELYDWLITLDGFKLVNAALSAPDYDLLAHINAAPVEKVGLENLYYAIFARTLEVFSTAVYYPADKRRTRADLGSLQFDLTAMVVRYMHPYWAVVLPHDPPTSSRSVKDFYSQHIFPLAVYPIYPPLSSAYQQVYDFWHKSKLLDLYAANLTALCTEPPSLGFIEQWFYRQIVLCQNQGGDDLLSYALALYYLIKPIYPAKDVIGVLHTARALAYQAGDQRVLQTIDTVIQAYWTAHPRTDDDAEQLF
ncbi:hypothetical protein [Conchiformibius steedae]|uniref:hypothetical protein n=1 Tax=Conchiformibius steedae TaxID=153493 RepID=UPI0026EDAB87|nr:hypothetical protein [Conchiformibius steedae]